jgi:hypothetical protein
LPAGFSFRTIRQYKLGDQKHHVAEYDFQGSSFALVSGGSVQLGFDVNRPWEPTAEELESWEDTAEEYDLNFTLQEHIARATLRPRTVHLRPFLLEISAGEMGWEPAAVDDPEVNDIIWEHFRKKGPKTGRVDVYQGDSRTRVERDEGGPSRVEVNSGGSSIRVELAEDGTYSAWRAAECTHKELSARLAREGFRFPTSDEWEYACGAGTATLFRWGDHVPCDRYPTDISPEEAAWRRRWVLSGGKLRYPAGGFTSDWDLHRRPNAFGIFIAMDPYKFELVAEANLTRGGDGGSMICGGAGFFVGWLTLATAYFEKHFCRRKPKEPIDFDYTIGRRVMVVD